MQTYPYLPLDYVEKWVPEAARQGVSVVARSPTGFLAAYRRAEGDPQRLSARWHLKRHRFIERHMAQVDKRDELLWVNNEPSRRALSFIMWAYWPS